MSSVRLFDLQSAPEEEGTDLGDYPRQMQPLVREFFQRVHDKVRDQELLEGIRPMIRKQDYKRGAPNQWRAENANPPFEVALAAARLTGISIDELVFGDLQASRLDQVEAAQRRTEETLEEIRRLLDLRGRSGPGAELAGEEPRQAPPAD